MPEQDWFTANAPDDDWFAAQTAPAPARPSAADLVRQQIAAGLPFGGVGELIRQHTTPAILPTVGGIVGGTLGSAAGGPVGAIGGATLGGGAGEAARQLLETARGTPMESSTAAAKAIGLQGGLQGAAQGLGEGLGAAAEKLAPYLMGKALNPTARLQAEFPDLTDTMLEHALTVSKGGYGQARALLIEAKGTARAALQAAEQAGQTIPIQVTPEIVDSLQTTILEQAMRSGRIPQVAGQPLATALQRADPATKAAISSIATAAETGATLQLTPTLADAFKTQLQRESKAVFANALAANGPKAVPAMGSLKTDLAANLNTALDSIATGYKAANARAQDFIGASRAIGQATRYGGNLLRATVRPTVGAVTGGIMGYPSGHTGAGAVIGALAGSPAGLSYEALALAHPAVQMALTQGPRAAVALAQMLGITPEQAQTILETTVRNQTGAQQEQP